MKKEMDAQLYLKSMNIPDPLINGGQELIFPDIIACLSGCKTIFVPFYSSGFLVNRLLDLDYGVCFDADVNLHHIEKLPPCDAIYFGTPTIVNDKPLFPVHGDSDSWNKEYERMVVKSLCKKACQSGYKKIISGLGSGDISVIERIEDMCCTFGDIHVDVNVVAQKYFNDFDDYVIVGTIEKKGAKE